MKTHSSIRAGLLASALLLSTAFAGLAHAQSSYSHSDRGISQTLPDLSPEDIARDVKRDYNQRSRTEEFIAPTFDPFEEDLSMAGSVNLRHVGGTVTAIDGQELRGGTLMDISFYYNSPSDDPYHNRGFTEAAFLSGSLAPVMKRDTRILECSRNVQNVVYDHSYYTTPLFLNFGFYRPYRHYSGHRRFGSFHRPYSRNRGFGYSYNRSRNRYDRRRGTVRHNDTRLRDRRSNDRVRMRDNTRDNNRDRDRDRVRDRNRDNDRGRNADRNRRSNGNAVRIDRRGRMNGTVDRDQRAANRDRNAERRNTVRSNDRNENRPNSSRERVRREDIRGAGNRNANTQNNRARVRTSPNAESPRTTRVRRNVAVSTRKHPQASGRSAPKARSAPKVRSESTRRSEPKVRSQPKARSAPKSRPKSQPKSNRRSSRTDKSSRVLNFFSGYSSSSRDVVRSVDVDCAREEMLSVYIPNDRLSAARFDGLTILALDDSGQEYPIFIPPNYIEGFQMAVKGGYSSYSGHSSPAPSRPDSVYRDPAYSQPSYSQPTRPSVSAAPCPAGTTIQADGSCMIVSGRYPQ